MSELTAEEAEKAAAFRKYLSDSGVLDFTTQCARLRSWLYNNMQAETDRTVLLD